MKGSMWGNLQEETNLTSMLKEGKAFIDITEKQGAPEITSSPTPCLKQDLPCPNRLRQTIISTLHKMTLNPDAPQTSHLNLPQLLSTELLGACSPFCHPYQLELLTKTRQRLSQKCQTLQGLPSISILQPLDACVFSSLWECISKGGGDGCYHVPYHRLHLPQSIGSCFPLILVAQPTLQSGDTYRGTGAAS